MHIHEWNFLNGQASKQTWHLVAVLTLKAFDALLTPHSGTVHVGQSLSEHKTSKTIAVYLYLAWPVATLLTWTVGTFKEYDTGKPIPLYVPLTETIEICRIVPCFSSVPYLKLHSWAFKALSKMLHLKSKIFLLHAQLHNINQDWNLL